MAAETPVVFLSATLNPDRTRQADGHDPTVAGPDGSFGNAGISIERFSQANPGAERSSDEHAISN